MVKELKQPTEEEKLRELVWVKARPGSSLEWIIERKEFFKVSPIERDNTGYFIKVSDDFLKRNQEVYLDEETIRKENIHKEIDDANKAYDERINQSQRDKQSRALNRKRIIKRGLVYSLLVVASAFGVHACIDFYNNPQQVQSRRLARENAEMERILDKEAISIIPKKTDEPINLWGEETTYTLSNGQRAIVNVGNTGIESRDTERLYIATDKEKFLSEWYNGYPSDDAKNLDILFLKTETGWQKLEGNKITQEKRDKYRSLIREIAALNFSEKSSN